LGGMQIGDTSSAFCLRFLESLARLEFLSASGVLVEAAMGANRDSIQQGIYTLMRDDEPPTKAFDLDYYFFAFVLWAVGLVMSLLVFFVEFVKMM